MLARLTRDSGMLFLVLGLYFALQVGLRLAFPRALDLDEGQQLFLAQWLAIGYDSQPPFYNWLQYGVAQMLGTSVLALALLKNVMLFSSYLLVGAAAFVAIRNRALAIISVLGLLTLPQVAFEAQRDLTHTVAVLFAASLFVYALFSMLERGRLWAYALTGIAIGIGLLSKYNFALLPVAALIGVLAESSFRGRLWNWRILLIIVLAAAIVTPHARWFLDNIDVATGRTLTKMTSAAEADRVETVIAGLFSLVAALVGFCALTVVAFGLSFGRRFVQALRASSPWTRLVGTTFVAVIALLVLLVVVGGTSAIKDRWLLPYFFMLPLYFSLKLDALNETIGNAPKRFGIIALAVLAAVPVALVARVVVPHWTGDYGKLNVPYRPAVERILAESARRPALVLAEDLQLAGNIRLAAPDIPVVVPGYERFVKGVRPDGDHPLLVVWRGGNTSGAPIPDALRQSLTHDLGAGTLVLDPREVAAPYLFGRQGDVFRFGYMLIEAPAP